MKKKRKTAQAGLSDFEQNRAKEAVSVYWNVTAEPHLLPPIDITLNRRTASSFNCEDPVELSNWLRVQGYADRPTTNTCELARLRNNRDGLVIVYHSGSIVVGGPANGATMALALLRRRMQGQYALSDSLTQEVSCGDYNNGKDKD